MTTWYAGNSGSAVVGNDANDGLSPATPKTALGAYTAAAVGDTIIYLASPVYYLHGATPSTIFSFDKQLTLQAETKGPDEADPLGDGLGSVPWAFERKVIFDGLHYVGKNVYSGTGPFVVRDIAFTPSVWPDWEADETWSDLGFGFSFLMRGGVANRGAIFERCEFFMGYGPDKQPFNYKVDAPTSANPTPVGFYPAWASPGATPYYQTAANDGRYTTDITQAKGYPSSVSALPAGWGDDIWAANGSPTSNPFMSAPGMLTWDLRVAGDQLIVQDCHFHDAVSGVSCNNYAPDTVFDIIGGCIERIYIDGIDWGCGNATTKGFNYKRHSAQGLIYRNPVGNPKDLGNPHSDFSQSLCQNMDASESYVSNGVTYQPIRGIEYSNNICYAEDGCRGGFQGHWWTPGTDHDKPIHLEAAKIRRSLLVCPNKFLGSDCDSSIFIDRCIAVTPDAYPLAAGSAQAAIYLFRRVSGILNGYEAPRLASLISNTIYELNSGDNDRVARNSTALGAVASRSVALSSVFADPTAPLTTVHSVFEAFKPIGDYESQGHGYSSVREMLTAPREFSGEESFLGLVPSTQVPQNTPITSDKIPITGGNIGDTKALTVSAGVTWTEFADDGTTVVQSGDSSAPLNVTTGNYVAFTRTSSPNMSSSVTSTIRFGGEAYSWAIVTASLNDFPIVDVNGNRLTRTAVGLLDVPSGLIRKLSLAVIVKPSAVTGFADFLTQGTGVGPGFSQSGANIRGLMRNSAAQTLTDAQTGAVLTAGNWHTILYSFDADDARFGGTLPALIYINGVQVTSFTTAVWDKTKAPLSLTQALPTFLARTNAGNQFAGQMKMLAVWADVFIDWSAQSNRDLATVDRIGENGEGLTGSRPSVFMVGKASELEAAAAGGPNNSGANRGAGGAITRGGANAFTAAAGDAQIWPPVLNVIADVQEPGPYGVGQPIDFLVYTTGYPSACNITPSSDGAGVWSANPAALPAGSNGIILTFTPAEAGVHNFTFTPDNNYASPEPLALTVKTSTIQAVTVSSANPADVGEDTIFNFELLS